MLNCVGPFIFKAFLIYIIARLTLLRKAKDLPAPNADLCILEPVVGASGIRGHLL